MMKLILVRHGQTEWNLLGKYQGQSDIALSEKGRMQAELLAKNFPVDHVDIVYASDLKRAFETGEKIAQRFGCPIIPEKGLREFYFGEWEGHTYKEIVANWPEEASNFFGAPEKLQTPGGETFSILQERAMKTITRIREINEGKTVVAAAHGAIIKTILASLMHIPLHYLWAIRQDNTAVDILRFDDDYVSVELINSTEHLRKL